MASTKIFFFYIMFLILYSLFYSYVIDANTESFNPQKYMVVSQAMGKLSSYGDDFLTSVVKIVLVPFLLIDVLVFVLLVITYTFTAMPAIISLIFITPLSIMVLLDYVLPWLRGN